MHLWVLLVFTPNVIGISRISTPGLKAVNFAKAKEGRRLKGSVIQAIEVESEGACRLQCVNEERCRSYNFGITINKGGGSLCQLSDSDRFAEAGNFTEDGNFKYRGIQVISLLSTPIMGIVTPSYLNWAHMVCFYICGPRLRITIKTQNTLSNATKSCPLKNERFNDYK